MIFTFIISGQANNIEQFHTVTFSIACMVFRLNPAYNGSVLLGHNSTYLPGNGQTLSNNLAVVMQNGHLSVGKFSGVLLD